jgi:hypothetical protein
MQQGIKITDENVTVAVAALWVSLGLASCLRPVVDLSARLMIYCYGSKKK